MENNDFNSTKTNGKKAIDVVYEFDYSTQLDDYNEKLISWRKDKSNPYAFNYSFDQNESIFIDGKGFVEESAAAAERDTLSRILVVIGIASLLIVLIDSAFSKVLIFGLECLNVDIHNSLFSLGIYGSKYAVITVVVLTELLKYIVPLTIVTKKFRLPRRVSRPKSMRDPWEVVATIAAVLVISAVLGVLASYLNEHKAVYAFFQNSNTNVSDQGKAGFMIYTFFDVIVNAVLIEFLFRGEMLAVLRQFGDKYAIIVTSILAGVVTQNFRIMPGIVIISMILAVGTLRSGTICAAVLGHIAYKVYMFVLAFIETELTQTARDLFIAGVFIIGVLMLFFIYMNKSRRNRKFLAGGKAYITARAKFIYTIMTFPLLGTVIVSMCFGLLKLLC